MDELALNASVLASHVRSIEELDALLLLRERGGLRAREVEEILRLPAHEAESALHALVAHGLVLESSGRFLYQPEDPDREAAVATLAAWNRTNRSELIVELSRAALSRVRIDAQRLFIETLHPRKKR